MSEIPKNPFVENPEELYGEHIVEKEKSVTFIMGRRHGLYTGKEIAAMVDFPKGKCFERIEEPIMCNLFNLGKTICLRGWKVKGKKGTLIVSDQGNDWYSIIDILC